VATAAHGGKRAGLIEGLVREEIYYREGLALGFDQDDTVIRWRLRQNHAGAGGGALLARLYPLVMRDATRSGGRGLGVTSYLMGGIAAVWFVGRVAAF
jgi:hypothetical protein